MKKNKINFFEIGHTIVDNIISYINKRDLDEEINEDTKKILIKYKDILEKKKQISMFVDLETLKEKKNNSYDNNRMCKIFNYFRSFKI